MFPVPSHHAVPVGTGAVLSRAFGWTHLNQGWASWQCSSVAGLHEERDMVQGAGGGASGAAVHTRGRGAVREVLFLWDRGGCRECTASLRPMGT
jgi:hypothetical protein